ncbi:MAG TPA: hypothetical protein VI248_01200 [Kineosporiaceae bacterium]
MAAHLSCDRSVQATELGANGTVEFGSRDVVRHLRLLDHAAARAAVPTCRTSLLPGARRDATGTGATPRTLPILVPLPILVLTIRVMAALPVLPWSTLLAPLPVLTPFAGPRGSRVRAPADPGTELP